MPDEPLPPPKSPPPAGPYREPWKAAETATHIDQFERAADLQEHLLKLRGEVDAGKHDARSADELSGLIAKLTRARENLRRFVRYRVGGPRWALGVIGSFGAISALYTMLKGMPLHERPELLVFAITAAASVTVACVVLLTSALRWGDCLPEYDGLIADLRKLSEARRREVLQKEAKETGQVVADMAAEIDGRLQEIRRVQEKLTTAEVQLEVQLSEAEQRIARDLVPRTERVERAAKEAKARVVQERVRVVEESPDDADHGDAEGNRVQTTPDVKKRGES
ncbi:MAG: hypothetical protein U0324_03770 [Polyangiales bacterium]